MESHYIHKDDATTLCVYVFAHGCEQVTEGDVFAIFAR